MDTGTEPYPQHKQYPDQHPRPSLDMAAFLADGGEAGALMRAYDWSATSLGPVESWPQSLRAAVRILLTSRFAMWLGWGEEVVFLYNDAYAAMTLGKKHPWALGKPTAAVWPEIWPDVEPRINKVLKQGQATWDEALLLFLERSGYSEETYHTFSYSPLSDDTGAIAGILCVVSEETERVISERRLNVLQEAGVTLASASTQEEIFAAFAHCLEGHAQDLPFTLTYRFHPDGKSAHLVSRTGIPENHPLALDLLQRDDPGSPWPLQSVRETANPVLIDLVDRVSDPRFASLPVGPWDKPPTQVLVLPLVPHGQERHAVGFIMAGLNPYRPFDPEYRGFIQLLTSQVAASLANANLIQSLERERARLTELFMQAPAFIAVTRGPEHIFDLVNEPYLQMVGHRDVVGKPVRTVFPEVAGQGIFEILDNVYQTGEPFVGNNIRVELQTKANGPLEERYLDFLIQPQCDDQGNVDGIFVHGVDLTDLKRAADERERFLAREQEARTELEAQRDELIKVNADLLDAGERLAVQQAQQAATLRSLRAATQAAKDIVKADSEQAIADSIVATLRNDFNARVAGIWLSTEKGKKLVLVRERGLKEVPTRSLEPEIDVALEPYIIGWVARFNRPSVVRKLEDSLHFDNTWLKVNSITSAVVLPLSFQGSLLGVVAAFFTEELPVEISDVLSTLASVAAASLHSHRAELAQQ